MQPHSSSYDVIIIGGGMVGLAQALTLADASLSVLVIDQKDPKLLPKSNKDGRVSAIALGSKQFLESIDCWHKLKDNAGPIHDIRVVENYSNAHIDFDHKMISHAPMGYMVENIDLMNTLYLQASLHPSIHCLMPSTLQEIQRNATEATITLTSGKTFKTPLIIAADGKNSWVKSKMSIDSWEHEYNQTAIVFNVKHDQPHHAIAIEHFFPTGPFAILPMHTPNHSSIVWTIPTTQLAYYQSLSDQAFTEAAFKQFGNFWGEIEIISPKFYYPLSLRLAKSSIDTRIALIGDALHAIHPIAGQGYNLALRDVAQLSEIIIKHKKLGLDYGNNTILKKFQSAREADILRMVGFTTGINSLFSNPINPLIYLRKTSLSLVNNIPNLKHIFMQYAMGLK